MKLDPIKQFSRLRDALHEERSVLRKRLSQIDALLGSAPTSAAVSKPPAARGRAPVRRRARRALRARNAMSLKQAIIKATQSKPLTKDEILAAVKKFGYKFSTPRPMATLNAYLYRKAEFERKGGRFSPKAN